MKYLLPLVILLFSSIPAQAQTTAGMKEAIFAMGCFWCGEADFEKVEGVSEVISGYTAGDNNDPTYENHPGHYEAVKVIYNPDKVSYETLLEVFWRNHDPFDKNGQFCDRGDSYRAAIFPKNEMQRDLAVASKKEVRKDFEQKLVTPIIDAEPFYKAEDYHQDYYKKNKIKYKFYRWNCGRDQRLEEIWG